MVGKLKNDFLYLAHKVQSKGIGWEANRLSQASRTYLIKVVSNAMTNFAMSAFRIHKTFLKDVSRTYMGRFSRRLATTIR